MRVEAAIDFGGTDDNLELLKVLQGRVSLMKCEFIRRFPTGGKPRERFEVGAQDPVRFRGRR